MNKVLLQDLIAIAESNLPFKDYKKRTFLVTGATGLIGSLLVKALLFCNQRHDLELNVVALVRNKQKAEEILGREDEHPELQYVVCDLEKDDIKIDEKIDYIVHAAAITNSKTMVTFPVDTIRASVNGTDKILNLALENNIYGMVYISSMEVYGSVPSQGLTTEENLGIINLANVRSCYPESKRLCECLCTAYSVQHGLNVKSARLAQTFGAGILPNENRVFAQFASSAMKGEDIVLHTEGKSEGNYVYTRDAIIGILLLLTRGKAGEAYNIVNEQSHVTISQMAKLVSDYFGGGKSKVVFDIPESTLNYGYAPDVKLHLSADKMKCLGWIPEVGIVEAYKRMISYLQEESNNLS